MSVSLLAVAAIAASVLLTRQKDEQVPGVGGEVPPGETLPAHVSLDAIRAAGL